MLALFSHMNITYAVNLTITINDSGRIETRTYQKPMNLYLYISVASAHPLGVCR